MPRCSFVVFIVSIAVVNAGGNEKAPNAPPERVKLVRSMYEKLPCEILGIEEPLKKPNRSMLFDGGSIILTIIDAKDKEFKVQLDRKINSKTRDSLIILGKDGGRLPHLGPEESAIYGLLLRNSAKPPANTSKAVTQAIDTVLQVLDARFANSRPLAKD